MSRCPWYAFASVLIAVAASVSLAFAPSTAHAESAGVIYVVDAKRGVIRVDPSQPAGSNQTIVSSDQNFMSPADIALAADGKLYVVDRECCGGTQGGVIRVDPGQPANSNQTIVSSGQNFLSPAGIALAADGKLYVVDSACCGGFNGGVIRVDPAHPANSNQTIISSGQKLANPQGVALTSDGKLYVTDAQCCDAGHGGVIRVDPSQPANGNQTIVSSGQNFVDPAAVALAADGKLFVADWSCCGAQGGVIRVDPGKSANSNQTVLSVGQNFADPYGIALASDGKLYVVDPTCCSGGNGGVIRVDPGQPAGSNQIVIANGGSFLDPVRLAVVPSVSIADATVTEDTASNVNASFTVTLAPWSPLSFTVPFTSATSSATANIDFNGAPGSVTFSPGQTSKTATVSVWGDAQLEPTETFTVTIQPPAGVGAARATATGTIVDNDAPAACSPRPRVVVTKSASNGKLQVHVVSSPLSNQQANPLQQLKFGTFQNAKVTLNGQLVSSGQTVSLPGNASTADFTVERVTAGQPSTVPLVVVDMCGDWKTLVGGGIGAGF